MFVEEEGGECLEHRHLDLDRTFAAPRARHQRGEDAIDRMERRDLVGEDRRDEGGIASGRAPQPRDPAGRLDDIVERRAVAIARSEEHTSELQSLMRITYAGFCLKKKNTLNHT